MTSAYPIKLGALTQQVKELAAELGEIPSRNRIMRECKVGADKAKAVLTALDADGFTVATTAAGDGSLLVSSVTGSDPVEVEVPTRRLHSVPLTDVERAESTLTTEADTVTEVVQAGAEVTPVVDPVAEPHEVPPGAEAVQGAPVKRVRSWPLLLLAAGAFVAIWGGWTGLGELTGFGPVRLLPGIADRFVINSAITLPLGVEAYAAYAMRVWLSSTTRSDRARAFARWSAIGSLVLGALGQVAYHLMKAAGITVAPWWITTFVSVLPVVVLGCGAALTHLMFDDDRAEVRR